MLGLIVGPYHVVRLLGRGGMGDVYEAINRSIERHVAIKFLNAAHAGQPKVISRFLNEARATNRIDHPGIVQIHESGFLPNGSAYIVMELLKGMTLAERLRQQRPMAIMPALQIAWQIAVAVAAAHEKSIVHRDTTRKNKICSLTGHKATHRRRTDDADALFTHWPL